MHSITFLRMKYRETLCSSTKEIEFLSLAWLLPRRRAKAHKRMFSYLDIEFDMPRTYRIENGYLNFIYAFSFDSSIASSQNKEAARKKSEKKIRHNIGKRVHFWNFSHSTICCTQFSGLKGLISANTLSVLYLGYACFRYPILSIIWISHRWNVLSWYAGGSFLFPCLYLHLHERRKKWKTLMAHGTMQRADE